MHLSHFYVAAMRYGWKYILVALLCCYSFFVAFSLVIIFRIFYTSHWCAIVCRYKRKKSSNNKFLWKPDVLVGYFCNCVCVCALLVFLNFINVKFILVSFASNALDPSLAKNNIVLPPYTLHRHDKEE